VIKEIGMLLREARFWLSSATLLVLCALIPGPASAYYGARQIPIGIYNVNDAQGRPTVTEPAEARMYAIRFVLDTTTTLYRFFSGFNLEGVYSNDKNALAPQLIRTMCTNKKVKGDPDGPEGPENCESGDERYESTPKPLPEGWAVGKGRIGYAHGNGGTIRASLVPIKADGTPDMANVLAKDTFNPVARYEKLISEYSIPGKSGMLYSEFGGKTIQADTPYAVVYQNVDKEPRMNYVSYNSPVTNASVAGPNGQNTLDPNASGAVLGLDPREAVAWSTDSGATWGWGHAVGGSTSTGTGPNEWPDYVGSGDNDVKMPWYAWTTAEGAAAARYSNQPYYGYGEDGVGNYRLVVNDVPRAATLTEAGGYAPIGSSVGVVRVKNLRTGQEGMTASLGTGLQVGALDKAVELAVGDDYEITHSGAVSMAVGDGFQEVLKIVKDNQPYTTEKCVPDSVPTCVGAEHQYSDRAELFALPFPYFPTPKPPIITTSAATGIGSGAATLNGTVNPQGPVAEYRFEYGLTTAYGSKAPVPDGKVGPGSTALGVSKAISGLLPGTTYHYRLVAGHSGGTTNGSDVTFTTAPLTWSIQSSPNPAGFSSSKLLGSACPSSTVCFTVGEALPPSIGFAERWNGSAWSLQSMSFPAGSTSTSLGGVACSTTTLCTAVGRYTAPDGFIYPLAQLWNGSAWSVQTPPAPSVSNLVESALAGVSCRSSTCIAVGYYKTHPSLFSSPVLVMAERWDGASWSQMTVPNPPEGASTAKLLGVSCSSATACTAVGLRGTSSRDPVAELWNGASWSLQTPVEPTPSSAFTGVSCPSSTSCIAVGEEGTELLVERWNGAAWATESAPRPAGAASSKLLGVSCPSTSACVAVGSYKTAEGSEYPLVETWNGVGWSVGTPPSPAGATSNALASVSCVSSTICVAAGRSGGVTLIERSS
jgi:hypothetical protein